MLAMHKVVNTLNIQPEMKSSRPLVIAGVAFFLAIIALQLTLMARANSCTWDEADHTYAAYMQWNGDFGLNPEHPPLVKFLATLPLQGMTLKMPPLLDRPYRLQEVIGGRNFLFQNDANTILFRVRMAASILTLLLAVLVFLATQEMFGTGAGFVALALISFDPTLLGHSALMTTDAGQACFMLWAIYAFYRCIKSPTAWRLVTVGVVLGLALATKHSAVLLFPMLLLLAGLELLSRHKLSKIQPPIPFARYASRLAVALLIIGLLSIAVLWSSYGFRYAAREGGLQLNPAMTVQLQRVPGTLFAEVLGVFAKWHLLPESYLYGFAHVLFQSKAFHSYLLGTIYPHPVWFYFPIAMLIKSTLTFLILLGITVWAGLTCRITRWREILYMAIPAGIYMIFAMAGGMNIGVRHVLPIYIFLSVAIAGATWPLIQKNRRWLYAIALLLLFQAVSVLSTFPAYVSYANEAFGGPRNVHKYLSDSSSDWGQQMKSVKLYLDQRGIKNCWFAYFGEGVAEYSYYGIPCKPLITADSLYFDSPHDVPASIDGPVLMSAGVLSGFEFGPGALNPYEQFKSLKPTATIDYGVFVYDGHFDIPLAAALSHVQKAGLLLQEKHAGSTHRSATGRVARA
ncbi:glycosyltransferase family 39 protein [Tunturiibacter gelidiferens]|uniref:glycosyltransferase family 39 protein n=1 Tax=Tunturiibacter gelidiferens TaxID=3069689 RepID=UPI003D9B133F